MAFDEVDEDAVYLCTGNPLPADIESAVYWLFNDDFNTAFDSKCWDHRCHCNALIYEHVIYWLVDGPAGPWLVDLLMDLPY